MDDKGFDCKDCTISTITNGHYYMVHNVLWESAGMTTEFGNGMLCIDCLEKRLGRKLHLSDFTTAPVNEIFFNWVGLDRFL